MRTDKPYTNATFTKRVDHDAGRHRGPRAPSEPRVCVSCGAVYRRRRWVTADTAAQQGDAGGAFADTPTAVRCPACRIIAHGSPAGMVVIDGEFPDPTPTRCSGCSIARRIAPPTTTRSGGSWSVAAIGTGA